MPRNDGVDRTLARNRDLSTASVAHAQAHNEREKDAYSNPDIVTEVSHRNVHYKKPDADYQAIFDRLKQEKIISTRGLKEDAVHFCELLFDVISAYFHNHCGYEFAKQFYADAYNAAMSDALGYDVFHYHLHVVYIPVVEKQILWSKRCKDPALVGTVKETIMQVSRSKKWESKPAQDENGEPILKKNGKPLIVQSYSVLQDQFFEAMRAAGYYDIERGQRGSTEQHLTVTQFKVQAEQERLEDAERQTQEVLSRLDQLLPELKRGKKLAEEFSADPETLLPPPKVLESAKTYRERLKPIWEKIVTVLRSLFSSYVKLKHEVLRLRTKNTALHSENRSLRNTRQRLYDQIDDLEQVNQDLQHSLRETTRDFDRAKKVLGEDTVDQAIEAAREQETAARKNRRRSRDYVR